MEHMIEEDQAESAAINDAVKNNEGIQSVFTYTESLSAEDDSREEPEDEGQ